MFIDVYSFLTGSERLFPAFPSSIDNTFNNCHIFRLRFTRFAGVYTFLSFMSQNLQRSIFKNLKKTIFPINFLDQTSYQFQQRFSRHSLSLSSRCSFSITFAIPLSYHRSFFSLSLYPQLCVLCRLRMWVISMSFFCLQYSFLFYVSSLFCGIRSVIYLFK